MPRRKTKKSKPFYTGANWTFNLLQEATNHCAEIAFEELGLDCYRNQIEVISSEQMLDAYSSVGLPVMYKHWSFGKSFISQAKQYKTGRMGLAYEIVINSNPCISYLMEENSMTMQTLVIAHAAFGHNHFFKNNNMFKEWTDAEAIIDYLAFAQKYIAKCEERYGADEVERTLDAAHALEFQGIDRYRRPKPISIHEERERQIKREEELQKQVNDLWRTLPPSEEKEKEQKSEGVLYPDEENILYFLEKRAPNLKPWQREILRIKRKLAQYFYPQGQTKVMNEGFASFTHYYIMNRLWEKGLIDDGAFLEFIQSHSGVLMAPGYDSPYFSGFNPYALGFDIFSDIKRICEEPTKEDEEWFPNLVNQDWRKELLYSAENFRDESFILQYLSPTIMRKSKMFLFENDASEKHYTINKIHNERGFKEIRSNLAKQYNYGYLIPDISIEKVNLKGDRKLRLKHRMVNGMKLTRESYKALKYLKELWGYDVSIESVDPITGKSDSATLIE